jgi:PIN domain nuclease of toxin-antitoxin system
VIVLDASALLALIKGEEGADVVARAAGSDDHVWPAAAPAAWLALSRSRFGLL